MKPPPSDVARKFNKQRDAAARRCIPFQLTFQWWAMWRASGHWRQRGRGVHQYVMARTARPGPYAEHNVRIVTQIENLRSHSMPLATRQRLRELRLIDYANKTGWFKRPSNLGRKLSPQWRQNVSAGLRRYWDERRPVS
jgi:hypothetical protein